MPVGESVLGCRKMNTSVNMVPSLLDQMVILLITDVALITVAITHHRTEEKALMCVWQYFYFTITQKIAW
jgi:hypothetical protein